MFYQLGLVWFWEGLEVEEDDYQVVYDVYVVMVQQGGYLFGGYVGGQQNWLGVEVECQYQQCVVQC